MAIFVGDIHGKVEYLPRNVNAVQVGDMGVGFVDVPALPNIKFIRGNHDNPELCQTHPCYIGDWKLHQGVLYIGGAGSIDRAWRTEGVDWWRNEELTNKQMLQLMEAIDPLFNEVTAVVAHDAPRQVYSTIIPGKPIIDRFGMPRFLDAVLERYRPKTWVCGHFHIRHTFKDGATTFHVLGECEQRNIPAINCDGLWDDPA